jgi:hypothetical protein
MSDEKHDGFCCDSCEHGGKEGSGTRAKQECEACEHRMMRECQFCGEEWTYPCCGRCMHDLIGF